MLVDFRDHDGSGHPACPRSLLKRVIAKAEKMGFEPKMSAEFEFFFFNETRDTLREKGFRDMKPIDPGMFGYSWVRTGQDAELMADILQGMADFGISIEGLHTETGPGVYEAALQYDGALKAADDAALFKTAMKQIAHDHGLTVTFMAKWHADLPGCSGHVHQSLWRDGKNAFSSGEKSLSKAMQHFLGGQMALMKDLTAVYSPTINSYKRYVPGVWAPLVPSWGVENRTCALRVIDPTSASAARVENRQPAADMNPYTAMAASLGAGLYGIEHEMKPPAETKGDPGVEGDLLPTTLRDAARIMGESKPAREVLGEGFVDHYLRTRDWECRNYEKAVTDWELERYFESV
jgi:glutamine synthetase